jgi:3-oxoacyl-[acyl-carrier protein] reductase
MIRLDQEIAVVTGSSRGIGAHIAKTLAGAGCKVVVNYLNNKEKAEAVRDAIVAGGGAAIAVQADVSNAEAVRHLAEETLKAFGAPTLLVNNASAAIINKKIAKTEWGEFQSTFEIAVRSAYNCCQAVTPAMCKARKGKIVNIVTQYSLGTPPTAMATYVTAKYALVGFSKCLAVELAPFGIQVNMVSPGFTETDLTAHLPDHVKQAIAAQTPLKRNATCADVAQAVLFLASPLADFMTGINLPISGGNTM